MYLFLRTFTYRTETSRINIYHKVRKIKTWLQTVLFRITVSMRIGLGTSIAKEPRPEMAPQLHGTITVLLDVDYSQYIHHIFTVWVLYFIFICLIVLTTFSGSRALYLLCIHPRFVGPMHFFVRKYIFYNRYFIYKSTMRIFDFSYATSFKLLDKGLFEIFGPYGAINITSKMARRVSAMQTGLLYHNTGILILGAIFLLMFGSVFFYAWLC